MTESLMSGSVPMYRLPNSALAPSVAGPAPAAPPAHIPMRIFVPNPLMHRYSSVGASSNPHPPTGYSSLGARPNPHVPTV